MKRSNLNSKVCAIALSAATLCVTLPVLAQTNTAPGSTAPGSSVPSTTVSPDSGTSGTMMETTTEDANDDLDLGWLGLLGLLGLAGLMRKPQEQRRSDTYVDPVTPTTTRSDYSK